MYKIPDVYREQHVNLESGIDSKIKKPSRGKDQKKAYFRVVNYHHYYF